MPEQAAEKVISRRLTATSAAKAGRILATCGMPEQAAEKVIYRRLTATSAAEAGRIFSNLRYA